MFRTDMKKSYVRVMSAVFRSYAVPELLGTFSLDKFIDHTLFNEEAVVSRSLPPVQRLKVDGVEER